MFELMLCSMFTILPDYLFRRYVQNKRIGRDITLFSVWFELRWGITACLVLTVSLITLIFYFHPSTKSAISFYRTVPILSEDPGRVAEVYVEIREKVKAGDPIFKLDSSEQEATIETARRHIIEIEAQMEVTKSELDAAEGRLEEAENRYESTLRNLRRQTELEKRSPAAVSERTIEELTLETAALKGSVLEATANKHALETQLSTLLPSQIASAKAELAQAEVQLSKATVYAGIDGTVEQFTLRRGDIVNPILRPAGILVPTDAGHLAILGGFNQIETQVIKVGMIAEATCVSQPFVIIPLVVADVQEVIAAGQLRPTDQLVEPLNVVRPGSLTVYLEPLYEGAMDGVPPGSHCIANAYTSNHDKLASEDLSTAKWVFFHVIDTVGLVHAMILRIQALLLPVQSLVFSGH